MKIELGEEVWVKFSKLCKLKVRLALQETHQSIWKMASVEPIAADIMAYLQSAQQCKNVAIHIY